LKNSQGEVSENGLKGYNQWGKRKNTTTRLDGWGQGKQEERPDGLNFGGQASPKTKRKRPGVAAIRKEITYAQKQPEKVQCGVIDI